MTHSSIRQREPGTMAARTCAFNDKRGRCPNLPARILAVPRDFQMKRHMGLCDQHLKSFKKDQPAEYKARLDLSVLEWRNYAVETYGGIPTCSCVGCQVVS